MEEVLLELGTIVFSSLILQDFDQHVNIERVEKDGNGGYEKSIGLVGNSMWSQSHLTRGEKRVANGVHREPRERGRRDVRRASMNLIFASASSKIGICATRA